MMKRKRSTRKKTIRPGVRNAAVGTIVFFAVLYVLFISDQTGTIGRLFRNFFFRLFGVSAWGIPGLCIASLTAWLTGRWRGHTRTVLIWLSVLSVLAMVFIALWTPGATTLGGRFEMATVLGAQRAGFGWIGALLGGLFIKLLGKIGGTVILTLIFVVGLLVLFRLSVRDVMVHVHAAMKWLVDKIAAFIHRHKEKRALQEKEKAARPRPARRAESAESASVPSSLDSVPIIDYQSGAEEPVPVFHPDTESVGNQQMEWKELGIRHDTISHYNIPSLDLLDAPKAAGGTTDRSDIQEKARKIEQTLVDFGVDARVTQVNRGPSVTCFELEPAPGVKVSRIVNLTDDLALSLATNDIRIIAPMPGKAAVGIEVPNDTKDAVTLREILESPEFSNSQVQLPFALGKTITGKPIVSAIEKMPHLLIAGATGSGKSVCINTIIMSILYHARPDEVKLILIDPKVVELSVYNDIPHLNVPVVTQPKKASAAMFWAVEEMERRYKLFSQYRVRDIASYKQKALTDPDMEPLPYIVIIIDELADLMMVAASEVESYIARLAQMARACGMHLIVATQRPSVDVITGTIKANIPSRISFQVSSQIDSRTILDAAGAEKLLGKGDMLFYPSGFSKPIRVQGAYVSEREVERVVAALRAENEPREYDEEMIQVIEQKAEPAAPQSLEDPLLLEAAEMVIQEQQASVSQLQRRMRIGHSRAGRLIDELEQMGVVGPHEGSKPRRVLMTENPFGERNYESGE